MPGVLGMLIWAVAQIYLSILLLRLLIDPRQWLTSPFLSVLHQGTEPVVAPLRRMLGSETRAVLAAIVALMVVLGLTVAQIQPAFLVLSPLGAALAMSSMPVLPGILLSVFYVVETLFLILVISIVVTVLIERYTVNPITLLAYRIVETAQGALGPIGSNLGSEGWMRGLVGVAGAIVSAGIGFVFLLLVRVLSGGPMMVFDALRIALASPVFDAVYYGIGFFILVIIVSAVLSWFSPDPRNPLVGFTRSIAYPILEPFRRLIPTISGIDISPIFAILLMVVAREFGVWLVGLLFLRP